MQLEQYLVLNRKNPSSRRSGKTAILTIATLATLSALAGVIYLANSDASFASNLRLFETSEES